MSTRLTPSETQEPPSGPFRVRRSIAADAPRSAMGPVVTLLKIHRRRRGLLARRDLAAVFVPVLVLIVASRKTGSAFGIEFVLGLAGMAWVTAESWALMKSLRTAAILRDLAYTPVSLRGALLDATNFTIRSTRPAAWVWGAAFLSSGQPVIHSPAITILFATFVVGCVQSRRALVRIGTYWGFGYNLRESIAHGILPPVWGWAAFLIFPVFLIAGMLLAAVYPLLALGGLLLAAGLCAVTLGVENRPATEEAMRELLEERSFARSNST